MAPGKVSWEMKDYKITMSRVLSYSFYINASINAGEQFVIVERVLQELRQEPLAHQKVREAHPPVREEAA